VATRRNFTQGYKDQAVSLVLDSGRSIAEVAKSIGVHEMTLGKWVKKARGKYSEVPWRACWGAA
jgi:transposase